MTSVLTLLAEFDVLPGEEERVAGMISALADLVRQEDGNVVFEPYTRRGAPRHHLVYEVYRDAAAFEAHITATHTVEFNRRLAGLIEGDGSELTWLDAVR